jgi:hypothetical protein
MLLSRAKLSIRTQACALLGLDPVADGWNGINAGDLCPCERYFSDPSTCTGPFAEGTCTAESTKLPAGYPFESTGAAILRLPAPIKSESEAEKDRQYSQFQLPNGLRVLVTSDPSTPTASASMNVQVALPWPFTAIPTPFRIFHS